MLEINLWWLLKSDLVIIKNEKLGTKIKSLSSGKRQSKRLKRAGHLVCVNQIHGSVATQ
jgi:hypothetical protein